MCPIKGDPAFGVVLAVVVGAAMWTVKTSLRHLEVDHPVTARPSLKQKTLLQWQYLVNRPAMKKQKAMIFPMNIAWRRWGLGFALACTDFRAQQFWFTLSLGPWQCAGLRAVGVFLLCYNTTWDSWMMQWRNLFCFEEIWNCKPGCFGSMLCLWDLAQRELFSCAVLWDSSRCTCLDWLDSPSDSPSSPSPGLFCARGPAKRLNWLCV